MRAIGKYPDPELGGNTKHLEKNIIVLEKNHRGCQRPMLEHF